MWALDLGTTNSLLARWDTGADRPAVVVMPAICRSVDRQDPLEAPRVVPSAVHVLDAPSALARLTGTGFFARHLRLGKLAEIGRPALELNRVRQRACFAPTFKRALSMGPLLTVARAAGKAWSAREVARLFLRELLGEAKAATGERIRELVVTCPVEAFETYRAELAAILGGLGVSRVRFIDEPVAAALGYGIGLTRPRRVLVADFGAGTMHLALVRLEPAGTQAGRCEVIAKAGRDAGGNLVDRWVLEDLCRRLSYRLGRDDDEESRLWHGLMLADACRAKERVFFAESAVFELAVPEHKRAFEARLRGDGRSVELTREDLVRILEENGLYALLRGCLDEVLAQARAAGVGEPEIDDVLMVGGSTLLPGIYPIFEEKFGRDRVRAWQPFEAIAYGGCAFASGRAAPADFIVHDYALLTYDLQTKKPQHSVIVPRGTRVPTAPDFWKRQLVPTCSLGEPERIFKLVICELGEGGRERTFSWDADGRVHKLGGETAGTGGPVVVKLNESNPALGALEPPHAPSDRAARLEVSFGVNADRWLCATVLDLRTRKPLMKGEPVVRIL